MVVTKKQAKKMEKTVAGKDHVGLGRYQISGVLTCLMGIGFAVLHMYHVSTLYENDRNFSHLSTMEREMGFRTEMGLYYSYFKTMVEAPSISQGLQELYANNLTEYPSTINVLQRFNVYPELFLGLAYRALNPWLHRQCWTVNRGDDRTPVQSCEGLGEPAYFYLSGVWFFAGLTAFSIFVLATFVSGSKMGGLLAIFSFFFNHEECTRVMWTPPLRESFGYPLSLLQILLVSKALNKREAADSKLMVIPIGIVTCLYLLSWQFAQFTLFTQVSAIFGLHVLGLIPNRSAVLCVLQGNFLALISAFVLLFMNDMLLTSWLFSSIVSSYVLLVVLHIDTIREEEGLSGKRMLLRLPLSLLTYVLATFILKLLWSRALRSADDAHVFNLLKSKLTGYQDFDTLLYTCAREFDFLGWEMPSKTSMTLLLPTAILSTAIILVKKVWNHQMNVDPAVWYNVGQTVIYGIMAMGIMRLKLFFTPHLCIIAALIANDKILSNKRAFIIFCLLGLMSIKGYANIQQSYSRLGEYSDPPLEDLFDWINAKTLATSSFAGPMPLMANLLLSTRRPIINHPHYEDEGLRLRTQLVYQMYSRRTPKEYHQTLKDLKADYVVLSNHWCLEKPGPPCSMATIMDKTDKGRQSDLEPLCPLLFTSAGKVAGNLFQKVYSNQVYVVLKVI